MAASTPVPSRRWAVALAGGNGSRMRPMIQRWLGCDRPKQYCTFVGSRSMLAHTLARVSQLVRPEHTVTVVGRDHRRFLDSAPERPLAGRCLEQPADLGTAIGVLLPVAVAMRSNPAATIFVLPSDHFLYPEERFLEHLRFAELITRQHPQRLILLAATPDSAETDYGWVVPAARPHATVSHRFLVDPVEVRSFVEKPDPVTAHTLHRQGGLWNTMIVIARVRALWDLGWRLLPTVMARLDQLAGQLGARAERNDWQVIPERAFADLRPADFSRDVLQVAQGSMLALPMTDVMWSDWGRPRRVAETLLELGKRPNFPLFSLISDQGHPLETATVAAAEATCPAAVSSAG